MPGHSGEQGQKLPRYRFLIKIQFKGMLPGRRYNINALRSVFVNVDSFMEVG